jgi:membrane associated rhomboid family serine protease
LNLPRTTKLVAAALGLGFVLTLVPSMELPAYVYLAFEPRAEPLRWVTGAATYGLLHGSFMHLVGNLLGIVILGPLVERRHGAAALLWLLLLGAFAGALAHTLVQFLTGGDTALIGASASAAALIGWSLRQIRERRGFGDLDQAVNLYGALFILFNVIGIVLLHDSPVAYAAHVGGFAAGWIQGGRRI